MGLKDANMIQWEDVAALGDLELEAETGESLLIKGVDAWAPSDGSEFTEFTIGRLTVGYFNTRKAYANHLEQWGMATVKGNLLTQMVERGVLAGYPVAEGETFKVHNPEAAAAYRAVHYELYEAGDMVADMPNGSKSKEFSFVNYGNNSAEIAADTYGEADESHNPAEYPAFPFGEDVPSKTEIDIHALLVLNFEPTGATGTTRDEVRSLRLTKDREVMFDKTRVGQYCTQGMTRLSWGVSRQISGMNVEWLPKPITFLAGEELKVEMSVDTNVISADELEIAVVETVRRVE